MFLTDEELKELTGYSFRSRQIEWLRNHNWKFEVNARNLPKVARAYFEIRMGARALKDAANNSDGLAKPNFQFLKNLGAR
jgi:hypothetical protein